MFFAIFIDYTLVIVFFIEQLIISQSRDLTQNPAFLELLTKNPPSEKVAPAAE